MKRTFKKKILKIFYLSIKQDLSSWDNSSDYFYISYNGIKIKVYPKKYKIVIIDYKERTLSRYFFNLKVRYYVSKLKRRVQILKRNEKTSYKKRKYINNTNEIKQLNLKLNENFKQEIRKEKLKKLK